MTIAYSYLEGVKVIFFYLILSFSGLYLRDQL